MNNALEKSIGEIVAEDYRAARVFENHKIDFCCKGGRSLSDAAKEKNIDAQRLWDEISKETESKTSEAENFNAWPLDVLADYIVKTHHRYSEDQTRVLKPYLEKLSPVQSEQHAELPEIKKIFDEIAGEMAMHMKREELMLFPFIRRMVKAAENKENIKSGPGGPVGNRIEALIQDHNDQGDSFTKIADLSHDFQPPAGASDDYRFTLNGLKEFEADLHKHIHLENNILFPKAIALEKRLAL